MLVAGMLSSVLLLAAAAQTANPAPPRSFAQFAACWAGIDAYSATLKMHETDGASVQDRAYAYTFKKPSDATIEIIAGPGRGGKVVWTGGDEVIGSPPGLFSGLKVKLPLTSARVTSLRGDTIVMASFGWVLDHFRTTAGVMTERAGPLVDGAPTTEIALDVADPAADDGLTGEVLDLSRATNLPVDVRRYVGANLVKEIRYTDVVIDHQTHP